MFLSQYHKTKQCDCHHYDKAVQLLICAALPSVICKNIRLMTGRVFVNISAPQGKVNEFVLLNLKTEVSSEITDDVEHRDK